MKKTPEIIAQTPLVDALLADENWSAFSESFRPEAVGVLRARRRARSFRIAMAQAACLAGLSSGIFFLSFRQMSRTDTKPLASSSSTIEQAALRRSVKPIVSAGAQPHFISEEQMLKMLPAGSCVLAEIDGRPRLVFFERPEASR